MTRWIPTIAETDAWAEELHDGQLYGEQPYINHVRRVAQRLEIYGTWAVLAGLLHDTVEDAGITLQDLRDRGYPDVVVEAVDAVSLRPGEKYLTMVRRAALHDLGCLVKFADNRDNRAQLNELRCSDPARAERLATKYESAVPILISGSSRVYEKCAPGRSPLFGAPLRGSGNG